MKWMILSLLFCLSCTSVQEKKVTWSGMPKLKFQNHQAFLRTRTIASFNSELAKEPNRNIYFFALYNQFKDFKILAADSSLVLGSCPQFHHQILDDAYVTQARKSFGLKRQKAAFNPGLAKIYYPELNLKTNTVDVLAESDKASFSRNFKKAMKSHAKTLLNELAEMCNYGNSDQFYVFENFIRHLRANPNYYYQAGSIDSMANIPVVANIILTHSLADQFKLNKYDQAVLQRLKGSWVYHYVENLKKVRREIALKGSPNPDVVFENALNHHSKSFGR